VRRLVALIAAAAIAVACVTSKTTKTKTRTLSSPVQGVAPDTAPSESALMRDPDQLLRIGDYERAHSLLVNERNHSGATPELDEKIRTASVLAARARASRALRALSAGRLLEAQTHLERAWRYEPDLPAVRRAKEQIEPRMVAAREAQDLRDEAKRLMEISPERAVDLLVLAREQDPDDRGIIGLLQQATLRAEAERACRRAEAAWKAGDRAGVALALLAARYRGKHVADARKLIERIERELEAELHEDDATAARADWEFAVRIGARQRTLRSLRDAATERILERAGLLLSAEGMAPAALLEPDAQRMGVGRATPALDLVRRNASIEIVVFPFEDATGGEVDGLRVARALADRIGDDSLGGGLAVTVLGPGPDAEQVAAAHPRALRLRGTATSARVQRSRVGRTTETVTVQVGTRVEPGPNMEPLVKRLGEVHEEVLVAEEELDDAEDELRRIVDMPYIHPTRGGRSRLGEVYYNEMLRRAQARTARAKRDIERVRALDRGVREEIRAADGHLEIPIYEERERTVENHNISASVTIRLTLEDEEGTLLSQPVTGSTRHRETVAPGFPEGGVPEDADEAPDDVEMTRRAAAHFASIASGLVRLHAEKAARHFLEDARAAEKEGRRDDAAEAYALYLLATPEISSPQRAAAAQAFEELTGIHVPLHTGLVRGKR